MTAAVLHFSRTQSRWKTGDRVVCVIGDARFNVTLTVPFTSIYGSLWWDCDLDGEQSMVADAEIAGAWEVEK